MITLTGYAPRKATVSLLETGGLMIDWRVGGEPVEITFRSSEQDDLRVLFKGEVYIIETKPELLDFKEVFSNWVAAQKEYTTDLLEVKQEIEEVLHLWLAHRASIMMNVLFYGPVDKLRAARNSRANRVYMEMLESTGSFRSQVEGSFHTVSKPKGTDDQYPDGLSVQYLRTGYTWLWVEDLKGVGPDKSGGAAGFKVDRRVRADSDFFVVYGSGAEMRSFYVKAGDSSELFMFYVCQAFQTEVFHSEDRNTSPVLAGLQGVMQQLLERTPSQGAFAHSVLQGWLQSPFN